MHLGHQSLLAEVRNEARSLELPAVVICFAPLPRMYFQQQFASVLKTEAEPGIDAEKRAGTASAEFPALRPAPLFALGIGLSALTTPWGPGANRPGLHCRRQ